MIQQNNEEGNVQRIFLFIGILTLIFILIIFRRLIIQLISKEQLQAQQKIYEKIINNSSDAIIIADRDFKICYCNKATERIYKYRQEDLIGHFTYIALGSRNTDKEVEERINIIKSTGNWTGERKDKDAAGMPLVLHATVNAIKDDKEKITGYFSIHADITDIKRLQAEQENLAASLQSANTQLEKKVKDQTALMQDVFQKVDDGGFIAMDSSLKIVYSNKAIESLIGLKNNDLSGTYFTDFLSDFGSSELATISKNSFEKQVNEAFDYLNPKTGKWYYINIFPFGDGLFFYITDISGRKIKDIELHKAKRMYKFISISNDLILHSKTEEQIISSICDIAVENGGFIFSWVGKIKCNTGAIEPIQWAGAEQGYLKAIGELTVEDIPEGRGPTGKAARTGQFYYSNDIANDPDMVIWRKEALKRRYGSAIAFPVKLNEKVAYVFTLYAEKPFFFTEDEVKIIARVTDNISFALKSFVISEERNVAIRQLKKVSQAVEQVSSSILITDSEGKIEYVNEAFSKLTGYSAAEVMGKNPRILKTGHTSPDAYMDLWDNITHFKDWQGEFCNKKKNGEPYWEYAIISPIVNEEGIITSYVAVKENITERKKLTEMQKQLLQIFENTSVYIGTSDVKKNFLYANKAMRDILEIEADEDIKNYNIAQFRPGKASTIIKEVTERLQTEGKWAGENVYISKNGKEIPVFQIVILHQSEIGEPQFLSSTSIDLTKVKEAERELLRMNTELREFSRHLQEISEIEKKEIAREIHDELGQNLTGIKFGISWLKKHIKEDTKILEGRIDELISEINETMLAFRRIQCSLHPSILESAGLFITVKKLIDSFSKKFEMPIQFSFNLVDEGTINNRISLTIYRIIQESFTNILRYAHATKITLNLFEEHEKIILSIEDNGCGFDITQVDTNNHHGLLGIRERVYACNGSFNINSIPGDGTFIQVEIPLRGETIYS